MNSHGSAERSEDYPWETVSRLLPRSGRPIVHPALPAPHVLTALDTLAYRSAVEYNDHDTMGCTRYARFTHGYSWRTLRVQCNYLGLRIAPSLN